jgi:hypothetical protein
MHTMRRIGLILGTIVVASFGVLVALIAWLGPALGITIGIAIAIAVIAAYELVIGPWARRWGATDEEVHRSLPGDELLRVDAPRTTRAISIDAPPGDVFPWLRQIGLGRGGWYSYDWIDNDGKPSLERIDPSIAFGVGDRIEMMPGMGPTVVAIEPDHAIVSAGERDAWTLVVEPTSTGSRLISRWRLDWPKSIGTFLWMTIADPGAFVMERKMLLRLKRLAETTASRRVGRARV